MKLHELKPAKGSVRSNKRKGRGQGTGNAGTAGRGHKGAKSRSGYSAKRNFEGGQMPLQMRLPKVGFTNPNRKNYKVFNLDRLQEIADKFGVTDIDINFLKEQGFIKRNDLVKVLGDGELNGAINVSVHKFSASAKEAIEAKGGKVSQL